MHTVSRSAIVDICEHRGVALLFAARARCSGCGGSAACAVQPDAIWLRDAAAPAHLPRVKGAGVQLTIDSRVLGRLAGVCYVLPAMLMVGGGGLGAAYGDAGAVLGAVAGLALCGVLLRLYDSRYRSGLWQVEPTSRDSSAAIR